MAKQKQGGGGNRKHGRNKVKCANYQTRHLKEKHTLKRILQSNGFGPALSYSRSHGLPDPIRKK
jgi:hypothetical protein